MNNLKLSKILNRGDFHHTLSFAREPFCLKKGEEGVLPEFSNPTDQSIHRQYHFPT